MSAGSGPERWLRRRDNVRRRVRLERELGGNWPEREEAGRRRIVTRLFSHWTPDQLQGVVLVVFQKRVRPPREERRERRARRSEFRSAAAERRRKKKRSSIVRSLLFGV